MFEYRLNLEPAIESALGELKTDVQEESGKIMSELAQIYPGEIQQEIASSSPGGTPFAGGRRSKEGQPPAIVTRALFTSFRAQLSGKKSFKLQMAKHGFYLDPVFQGEGKGGGYLNRPFLEKPLESAVRKLESL